MSNVFKLGLMKGNMVSFDDEYWFRVMMRAREAGVDVPDFFASNSVEPKSKSKRFEFEACASKARFYLESETFTKALDTFGAKFDSDLFEITADVSFPAIDSRLDGVMYTSITEKNGREVRTTKNLGKTYQGYLTTLFAEELAGAESIVYPCCSRGVDTIALSALTGAKVTGIDIDRERLDEAVSNVAILEPVNLVSDVQFVQGNYFDVDFSKYDALATSMIGFPNGGKILKKASEAGIKRAVVTPCCYHGCYANSRERNAESKTFEGVFEAAEIRDLRRHGKTGANILSNLYALDLACYGQELGYTVSMRERFGMWESGGGKGGALVLTRE